MAFQSDAFQSDSFQGESGATLSGYAQANASITAANTYYISPTGNDTTGDGSFGNPWASLNKFYTTLSAGDIGYCRGGTYTGTANRNKTVSGGGSVGNPITIKNYPGETPIFDGEANGTSDTDRYFILGYPSFNHWVFDGLTLTNFCMDQNGVMTFAGLSGQESGDVTIRNCNITKVGPQTASPNTSQVIYFGAYFDTALVEYNIIVGPYPTVSTDGAGVGTDHAPSAQNLTIRRNVFDSLHKGIQLYGDDGDPTGVTGLFEHNTFVNCGRNIEVYRHGTITVRDNAGEDASESTSYNFSDPNDSAYTTEGYDYWGETITAAPKYGLTAGSSAIGGAHDGSDAGWVQFNVRVFAQAQTMITTNKNNVTAQAQAYILVTDQKVAQAQTSIAITSTHSAQSQALLIGLGQKFSQSQASILTSYQVFAQAQISLRERLNRYANASAYILNKHAYAQTRTSIKQTYSKLAQAQARLLAFNINKVAQSGTRILGIYGFAQAGTSIKVPSTDLVYAQASFFITNATGYQSAQTNVQISSSITRNYSFAQAMSYNRIPLAYAQVQTFIGASFSWAQSNTAITKRNIKISYAQTIVVTKNRKFAQALALILNKSVHANVGSLIQTKPFVYAQAQARIGHLQTANAQAYIYTVSYLVKYGNYVLPGYAQTESFISSIRVQPHSIPHIDSSTSEYVGLENKIASLEMRIWEDNYLDAKNDVQKAATILHASKGWTKLYIQYTNKYYTAIAKTIKTEQAVSKPSKLLNYTVEFEMKPWLTSDQIYTVSGTGLIAVTRTLDDGGWTPATIDVSGTNITISGYTASEFTGYISVSGAVNGLIITNNPYSASIAGENKMTLLNPDFSLYLGPETTYIDVSGATSCIITYNNRWYI